MLFRSHEVSDDRGQNEDIDKKSRGSIGHPQIGSHEDDRTSKNNLHSVQKGDQVWLDSRNLKTIYNKKMAPK